MNELCGHCFRKSDHEEPLKCERCGLVFCSRDCLDEHFCEPPWYVLRRYAQRPETGKSKYEHSADEVKQLLCFDSVAHAEAFLRAFFPDASWKRGGKGRVDFVIDPLTLDVLDRSVKDGLQEYVVNPPDLEATGFKLRGRIVDLFPKPEPARQKSPAQDKRTSAVMHNAAPALLVGDALLEGGNAKRRLTAALKKRGTKGAIAAELFRAMTGPEHDEYGRREKAIGKLCELLTGWNAKWGLVISSESQAHLVVELPPDPELPDRPWSGTVAICLSNEQAEELGAKGVQEYGGDFGGGDLSQATLFLEDAVLRFCEDVLTD